MSIQAVAWVLEQSESCYSDRLVMIAIANHIGPTGWAWPSIEAIAHEARVDRSTVFRAIDTLVDIGELSVKKRPGKSNLYGLTAMCDPSQSATPRGSQSATRGSHLHAEGVAICDPESLRTIKEPLARAGVREGPVSTPAPLPPEKRREGAEFMRAIREGLLPDRGNKDAARLVKALEPLPKARPQ